MEALWVMGAFLAGLVIDVNASSESRNGGVEFDIDLIIAICQSRARCGASKRVINVPQSFYSRGLSLKSAIPHRCGPSPRWFHAIVFKACLPTPPAPARIGVRWDCNYLRVLGEILKQRYKVR